LHRRLQGVVRELLVVVSALRLFGASARPSLAAMNASARAAFASAAARCFAAFFAFFSDTGLAIISGGDFDEAAGFVGAPVNVRARVRRARRGTERADGSFESRVGGSSNRGARRCAPAKRDGCGEASVNRFRHAPA
jgi:hypothetical protein